MLLEKQSVLNAIPALVIISQWSSKLILAARCATHLAFGLLPSCRQRKSWQLVFNSINFTMTRREKRWTRKKFFFPMKVNMLAPEREAKMYWNLGDESLVQKTEFCLVFVNGRSVQRNIYHDTCSFLLSESEACLLCHFSSVFSLFSSFHSIWDAKQVLGWRGGICFPHLSAERKK